MNVSRFHLDEYLETVAVRTLNRVGGKYETILHHNPNVNLGKNSARNVWPSFERNDTIRGLVWRPLALKQHGLCFTTDLPREYASAGVSALSLKLHSSEVHRMRSDTEYGQRGWLLFLHRRGHFRRRASTLAVSAKDVYETEVKVQHSLFSRVEGSLECLPNMDGEEHDKCWEEEVKGKLRGKLGCLFPWYFHKIVSLLKKLQNYPQIQGTFVSFKRETRPPCASMSLPTPAAGRRTQRQR